MFKPPSLPEPTQAYLDAARKGIEMQRAQKEEEERIKRSQQLPFLPRAATVPFPPIDMNNCLTKAVASTVGGGVMGMFLGPIFSSSVMSGSLDQDPNATFRQKVVAGWKDMYKAGFRMAKTFASVGLVYSAAECTIEKARGAHDYKNGLYAGCVAGGILGASGGPSAAAFGCAGFAVFSLAIDYFMTDTDPRDLMKRDKDFNRMLIAEKENDLHKAYERQAEMLDEIDIDSLDLTPEQMEELDRMIKNDEKLNKQ